ncbi:ANK_REP_REGION domain-containing protein [Nephila pilipes]|uniref:ANK_REP_REGION domain-containing protein n=1 Tax=Nephila pilipes TaxID=299642 RepID=A0A8X6PPA0_NEPPI|nr:ANK_REP_REGION domain-containing protein [Nephila pilipes]
MIKRKILMPPLEEPLHPPTKFSAIYNALKSISSDESLNQDNVIGAIKSQLPSDSDACKEWEKGEFSLDHVFTTVNDKGVESKHTLLTVAFNRADSKMANFLIKVGADVNAVGVNGLTPLIIAIERKCDNPSNKALVDLLMEAKADVNAAVANGMTPISKAVERGDLETFKALMEKKAKVDVKPPHGESLLEWAESHKQYVENKEDMEGIINTLKAPSEEKKKTAPEIATSTDIDNLKQTGEAESTIPTVPDETSGEISLEERDAEYALECQIEEIALSTDGQLPENNDINFTDAQGVTTTQHCNAHTRLTY